MRCHRAGLRPGCRRQPLQQVADRFRTAEQPDGAVGGRGLGQASILCSEGRDLTPVRHDLLAHGACRLDLASQPAAPGRLVVGVSSTHDQHPVGGPCLPLHLCPQCLRIETTDHCGRCVNQGCRNAAPAQRRHGAGAGRPPAQVGREPLRCLIGRQPGLTPRWFLRKKTVDRSSTDEHHGAVGGDGFPMRSQRLARLVAGRFNGDERQRQCIQSGSVQACDPAPSLLHRAGHEDAQGRHHQPAPA